MLRMKAILIGLVFFSLSACKKERDTTVVDQPGKIVARPTGQSTGTRVEKTISSIGGKIVSGDGKLEIIIPEGALGTATTIGIEPITRTLVDRPGNSSLPAYRLTPHGQQFLRPVTIRFSYSNSSFANVAFQDEEGKWRGLTNVYNDENSKTVSVKSMHFSDWTSFENIFQELEDGISVEVGKTVPLKIMTVQSSVFSQEDQDDENYYVAEPYEYQSAVEWSILNGPGNGSIDGSTTSNAVFRAPGSVPVNNPVKVEARLQLKSGAFVSVFTNINIIEKIEPGIHLKVGGSDWIHFQDDSFIEGESYIGSDGEYPFDKHSIYIRIAGGHAKTVGTWAWNDEDPETATTFEYILKKPAPRTAYAHTYTANDFDIWHMSPGNIRITEIKKDAFGTTWATGQFLIEMSTPFIEGTTGTPPAVRIEGNFKLRME